jgi:predicted ATPase
MLRVLAVAGYRSIRELVLPLDQLNLVTGPNGSGKANLYRALRLLADVAQSRVIPSLAREGGLESTLWAGPETISRAMLTGEHPVQGTPRKKPVSLRLGFAGDDFGYAIDLGLPGQSSLSTERSCTTPRSSASACGTVPCCGPRRCSSIAVAGWSNRAQPTVSGRSSRPSFRASTA